MKSKKQARDRALFRYTVVSKVHALVDEGIPLPQVVDLVAKEIHKPLEKNSKRLSRRTIYRWLSCYKKSEFDGLWDRKRKEICFSNKLPEPIRDFLVEQKRADEQISIPELIRKIKAHPELKQYSDVSRTTVWRACKRLNLPLTRTGLLQNQDMRRFSYQHRMQMVLCDGKYFRVGSKQIKRLAFIFIDDATRFILHSVVGASETKELFLRGLFECIKRHGLMTILFVDNGSGFIAGDSEEICAKLGIKLIYGTERYPEGHGKIERFNRTFKHDLLRHFPGSSEIEYDYRSLALRIRTYLDEDYNARNHSSIGMPPKEKFYNDTRPLRFPPSIRELEQKFILSEIRSVSKDNCVSINGIYYEMPLGYARTKQEIKRNVLTEELLFFHENKMIELKQLNPVFNATSKRMKSIKTPEINAKELIPTTSHADETYNEKFRPIVNQDGSFFES